MNQSNFSNPFLYITDEKVINKHQIHAHSKNYRVMNKQIGQ